MVTFGYMNYLMIIPGLFKQRRPRQFNYKPVFYDREKEILEERRNAYENMTNGQSFVHYKPVIRRGAFKEYHLRTHRNIHRNSNIRLIAIILLLGMMFYLLFLR